ncbi:hypothetical protein BvCmsHHP056_01547 [Escherichia coli]|nr:hypothetical protein BvCmsHHP056_01547 [Escherichia coli]
MPAKSCKFNILQWCRYDKTRQRRIRQRQIAPGLPFSSPQQTPQHPAYNLIRHLAGGAFRHCLHHSIFLPAARSGSAKQNILQSTKNTVIHRHLFPFRGRIILLLGTGLKAFLQHLIGGFPVHVILVLAIHRGVINQAVTLIFRHRPHSRTRRDNHRPFHH